MKPEDVILLLQTALVLLGSVFHNVSQERRRVAWSQTKPATNTLEISLKRSLVSRPLYLLPGFREGYKEVGGRKSIAQSNRNKGPTTSKAPSARPGSIRSLPFFAEWHPCKVGTEAETQGANSHTPRNKHPNSRRREGQQEWAQAEDKQQLNCAHMVNLQFINKVLFPISGMSGLPTASRLPHCSHNWQEITPNQWVLQVVQGSKLEMTSILNKCFPPRPLYIKNSHLLSAEIQKLIDRGSNKGPPLFKSVPKPDLPGFQERWIIQTSNQLEISEPAHGASPFQNGKPINDERSVKIR